MERPILFSTPMVQSILEGKKTQTRRVIKPQPVFESGYDYPHENEMGIFGKKEESYENIAAFIADCPYGKPGDTLWVRETWCKLWKLDVNDQIIEGTEAYYYSADGYNPTPFNYFPDENGFSGDRNCPRWKPSIHMPRTAARIFLTIKKIKVERLQDITNEDIRAEGAAEFGCVTHRLNFKHSGTALIIAEVMAGILTLGYG